MAAYGVNEIYTTTGNPLCDRLKKQFATRGAAAVTRRPASASVMIQRVQHGLDPYENAPNPLTEKRTEPRAVRHTDVKNRPAAARTAAAHPAQKNPAPQAARPAVSRPVSTRSVQRSAVSTAGRCPAPGTEAMRRRSAAAAALTAKAETKETEVRITRAPFPFTALVLLSIFTIMVMVIVYSFAQNYELTSEITTLEAQQRALTQTEKDLTLRLEERDDIRQIENIAVNEIGMVKNDLVENRFVTISGGNRVELAVHENEETDQKDGLLSNMLSAIGENFDKLKEYID